MTTNDHNPTSPPWLQSHSVDTAEVTTESAAQHTAQDEADASPAEGAPERSDNGQEPAEVSDDAQSLNAQSSNTPSDAQQPDDSEQPDPGQFAGFPAGAADQTTAYPQAGMPQYGPVDSFAPPGAQDQFAPYAAGQFAHAGPYTPEPHEPEPYTPEPYQQGSYQQGSDQSGNNPVQAAPYQQGQDQSGNNPVQAAPYQQGQDQSGNHPVQAGPYQQGPGGSEHSGNHPVQPPPEQHGGSYGDFRQEIGPDGLVRRVAQDAPQSEQTGPIYSWAPPPPPMQPPPPPQPMYQQPPMGQMPHTGQMPHLEQPGPPPGWQGGPSPQQQQPAFQPQHVQHPGQPGHSVNDLNLLKRARKAPRSGWRRAVHKATGGVLNPGESAADLVYRDLVERVNQPVRGDYRIAILSLKGGVGKTTTTVGLGSTFSSLRGDRVIAIDANPDLGTLGHRIPRQTRSTVRNLLEDQHITRYSDVRAHTSQAPSRLEVLASEQDPAVSEAFSESDYRRAISTLQSFYNIILTDCGTGLMHSAMAGVLDMASSLVLVTSPAIDGARSASATLDWLEHHGYGKLVERTVVVVNASRRGASTVDLDQLRKLFLDRTRAVQVVPFDDHLAEGAEIDLELVSKPTRRALLELAAMVADDFGYIGTQQYRPGPSRH